MGTTVAFDMRDVLIKLHRVVKDPFVWSAIGSLGLHLLIFGTLPMVASSQARDREAEIKGTVDVVELTTAEQARLPDIALAPTELPPLPNFASSTPQTSLLPVPSSGSFFVAPPPQPLFIPALPAPPSTLPPSFAFNSTPYQLPQPSRSIIVTVPTTPTTPSTLPPRLAPSIAQPSTNPAQPNPAQPNSTSPGSQASNQPPPNSPTPPTPPPSLAQVQQQRMARLLEEQRVTRERMAIARFNPVGTEAATDGLIAGGQWLLAINRKKSEIKAEAFDLPMPPQACLIREERTAIVGLVVDRAGKAVDQPKFNQVLVKSGHALLDDIALKAATARSYGDQTNDATPYQVTVNFKVDPDSTCPSPAAVNSPATT